MNLNNLIQYCREMGLEDPLSGISVPEPLKADYVRSAIVVRCGLLTPIYSEPDVFRSITADWFYTKQWTFEHLVKIIEAEYSPIENYDRYEDWTDTHTGTVKNDSSSNGEKTGSSARSEQYKDDGNGKTTETPTGQDVTTNETSAENISTYQPDNKSTVDYGKIVTTETENGSTSDREYSESNNERDKRSGNDLRTDDLTDRHIGHLHGNIGTTQNVEMLLGELSLIGQFDPYKWIAEQFEKDFMVWVY